MADLSAYDLLNRKRRGAPLEPAEIDWFIENYMSGEVADYQMGAFLMATAINGMTGPEMAALTQAMLRSGERWHLREHYDFIADKHSTGGVGDKVSLVLSPWVAACGVKIGMLSGRGLGHTGGTLDKLEAIPKFQAQLSRADFDRVVAEAGCVISTSTSGIAPADRRMYALRDVTGTVESLPLITASIMSKKLAMGASAIILDVKTGSGAFMRKYQDSKALAESLIAAAAGSGTRVEALITDMDRPLGIAAGNANEVIETFESLKGHGPADLMEVTRAQAERVLVMSGRYDVESANAKLEETLASGAALDVVRRWLAAQGADPKVVDDYSMLPQPESTIEVQAPRSGFISAIDTYAAGMFTVDIGAGRKRAADLVDYAAGVMFDKRTGDEVRSGDVIARIQLGKRAGDAGELRQRFLGFVEFSDAPPVARPLIHEHLT